MGILSGLILSPQHPVRDIMEVLNVFIDRHPNVRLWNTRRAHLCEAPRQKQWRKVMFGRLSREMVSDSGRCALLASHRLASRRLASCRLASRRFASCHIVNDVNCARNARENIR